MPELPEVEVVKRSLEKKLQNLIIKKVKIIDGNLRYKLRLNHMSKLIGKKIKKVKRRSKYLVFEIYDDLFMIAHLGMTGKFFFIDRKDKKFKTSFHDINNKNDEKYDKVIFFLQNNQKLVYNDVRKFGFIKIFNKNQFNYNSHFSKLGPEPLDDDFNFDYFKKYIKRTNRLIKNVLMDQKFVSGLGNIYVNETLFHSGVKPNRRVNKLTNLEINAIIKNTKIVLTNSIKLGGSSIKNFSSDDGKKGVFQQHFRVYGRKGKNCSNVDCNNKIIRNVIANRATFFCKKCQK